MRIGTKFILNIIYSIQLATCGLKLLSSHTKVEQIEVAGSYNAGTKYFLLLIPFAL